MPLVLRQSHREQPSLGGLSPHRPELPNHLQELGGEMKLRGSPGWAIGFMASLCGSRSNLYSQRFMLLSVVTPLTPGPATRTYGP